jgi:hypothetical protein
MDKFAPLIESALQHDAVVMRIEPLKLTAALVRQDHCRPDGPFGRFAVEPLKDSKDELPAGQGQQEPLVHVLREQEGQK